MTQRLSAMGRLETVEEAAINMAQLSLLAYFQRLSSGTVTEQTQGALIVADRQISLAGNRASDDEMQAAITILMTLPGVVRNENQDVESWEGFSEAIGAALDSVATAIREYRNQLSATPDLPPRSTTARALIDAYRASQQSESSSDPGPEPADPE
jgi:hypothetical protein